MSVVRERRPTGRRSTPCLGHSFGEGLRCRCGVSWWSQQRAPTLCPVEARQKNGAGTQTQEPQTQEPQTQAPQAKEAAPAEAERADDR